jgi:hypothetical protein
MGGSSDGGPDSPQAQIERGIRGHYDIWSGLETWEGSIDVTLECNGDFEVRMGEKNYPRTLIAAGNVNTRQLVGPANVS